MWLFTRYGFFSATSAHGRGRGADPHRIMVRARVRQHLVNLRTRFARHLGGTRIIESAATDYRYRMFVPKWVWSAVCAKLAGETEWTNFKGEVARYTVDQADNTGPRDHAEIDQARRYEHALHEVWAIMHRLQQQPATLTPLSAPFDGLAAQIAAAANDPAKAPALAAQLKASGASLAKTITANTPARKYKLGDAYLEARHKAGLHEDRPALGCPLCA